jgi:hypothetical protein
LQLLSSQLLVQLAKLNVPTTGTRVFSFQLPASGSFLDVLRLLFVLNEKAHHSMILVDN